MTLTSELVVVGKMKGIDETVAVVVVVDAAARVVFAGIDLLPIVFASCTAPPLTLSIRKETFDGQCTSSLAFGQL